MDDIETVLDQNARLVFDKLKREKEFSNLKFVAQTLYQEVIAHLSILREAYLDELNHADDLESREAAQSNLITVQLQKNLIDGIANSVDLEIMDEEPDF